MSHSRPVYSTETGRLCPDCGNPLAACVCGRIASGRIDGDGIVRISRETKGRKGKGVTLVSGIPLAADELKTLAKQLKQVCGTGGTIRGGVIEIQGDHRDRLMEVLKEKDYRVVRAGG